MSAKKPLTEKRIVELLQSLEKRIGNQIVESNKAIISTAEKLHEEVIERLDKLELETPTRREFDALKRDYKINCVHTIIDIPPQKESRTLSSGKLIPFKEGQLLNATQSL